MARRLTIVATLHRMTPSAAFVELLETPLGDSRRRMEGRWSAEFYEEPFPARAHNAASYAATERARS